MSFFEAVKTVLSKYAVFSGRARRKEYWYFFLFNVIAGFIVGFLGGAMQKPKAMTALSIAFTLAFLLPSIAVAVRRLHDTGRSGWWYLLSVPGIALSQAANRMLSPENMITPMAMALVSLAFTVPVFIWLCRDSQPGANRFGENPKGVLGTEVTQRFLQMAAAHEPPYVFLDPAMTTLALAVTAAMQRVFPGCDSAARLDAVLASNPQPELQSVDTDTLLVLLKYAAVCDPAAGLPRIQTLNQAILKELAQRGI